ncbi:hypothetical protein RRG08_007072 [Elysia crispata]|uniref:Uncharacterized protein n=1 Tax=Elysia crispata TaxID=231223 RepID=A0AAE1D214_9GAST|nr:hypothetical protein RRG08_007072 [Elysia crispata]
MPAVDKLLMSYVVEMVQTPASDRVSVEITRGVRDRIQGAVVSPGKEDIAHFPGWFAVPASPRPVPSRLTAQPTRDEFRVGRQVGTKCLRPPWCPPLAQFLALIPRPVVWPGRIDSRSRINQEVLKLRSLPYLEGPVSEEITGPSAVQLYCGKKKVEGKYVGNRPIKLRKSSWRDRNLEVVRKKEKEKKRLGLK